MGRRYKAVRRRSSAVRVRGVQRVQANVNQMGLRDRRPEDLAGPALPRIPFDDESEERVEERESEPEKLREVPNRRFGQAHRPAKGPDFEADDILPDRGACDRFGKRRVRVQRDAPHDPVDPRRPNVLEEEERPKRREDRDEVEEEGDHALQPMDLERAVVAEQVETAHHERIPDSHWRLAIKTSVRGTRRVDKSRPVGFRRGGCARRRAILPLPKQTASRLLVQGRFSDLVAEQDDRPGAKDRGTSPDECDGHPRWVGKRNRERGAKNDEGEHDETRPVELASEAEPHCNLGSHLFALLRAGGGQLRVHQSNLTGAAFSSQTSTHYGRTFDTWQIPRYPRSSA